jgi:hypothetical protein
MFCYTWLAFPEYCFTYKLIYDEMVSDITLLFVGHARRSRAYTLKVK